MILADMPIALTSFVGVSPRGETVGATWGWLVNAVTNAAPPAFPEASLTLKNEADPSTGYQKPATLQSLSLARFRFDDQSRGPYRSAKSFVESCAIAVESDGAIPFAEAQAIFAREGLEAVVHSTFNDSGDGARWRAYLPFNRPATITAEHDAAWRYLDGLFGGRIDPQPKDAVRFWYVPAVIQGRRYRAVHVPGRAIDLDALDVARETQAREADAPSNAAEGIPVTPIAPEHPEYYRRATMALDFLASAEPCISGTNGQKMIWIIALHLSRTLELPVELSLALVAGYNARCVPPWDTADWKRTLERAAEKGRTLPGPHGAARFLEGKAAPATAPGAEDGDAEDGDEDDGRGALDVFMASVGIDAAKLAALAAACELDEDGPGRR